MRWSAGFLILIGICFPSANLQQVEVEDYTASYKKNAQDMLYLFGNDLSITVSLGGDDDVTFTPFDLINIKSSVSKVNLITKGDDMYEVNVLFPMLVLQATCDISADSDCMATIMSFNYTATFNDENGTEPPTFVEGKIENPDAIEVTASITLVDELADKMDTAQSGVAQQIKEAINSGGPPGPLLTSIENALNESFLEAIFS